MIRLYVVFLLMLSTTIVQPQTVQGTLKKHAGQEIVLMGFSHYKNYELAKTRIDSMGVFKLQFQKNYKGMAVLKTQDNNSLLLMLTSAKIQLQGTHLKTPNSITFKNNTETALFFSYAKAQQIRTNALAAWSYLRSIYQKENLFTQQTKAIDFIKKELQRIEKELVAASMNTSKTGYLSWYMPMRNLLQDMQATLQRHTADFPKNIAYFRTIDFTNTNFKTSGLFMPLLEGHYFLLENIEQPSDSIATQMNVSTRYLIQNFKDDKAMLNLVSRNLFNMFEKRSLFNASEFLALTLLAEQSELLSPKLKHKLESYSKLKVGKIAPDIQLDSTTRLSDIKKTTLLAFVASACPECKRTNQELSKVYPKWKASTKNIELIFISIDTDKKAFDTAYANAPWAVYTDFNGWDSDAVSAYHVNGTPTYFLLDKNMKIISRPKSVAQIDAFIQQYL